MLRLRIVGLVTLGVLVAACGGSVPSSGAASAPSSARAQGSGAPGASVTPAAKSPGAPAKSMTPAASTDAGASDGPSASPDQSAGTVASAAPGIADACSGSRANHDFIASAARAVDWTVLCAVLPKGWFVSQGSYRLASGGKLLMGYKGPGGATISLSEGGFCTTPDGCVPAGTDIGSAALGPLAGTLVGLDGGGFAIVSGRGANPSWLMTTAGLDQATTVSLGAALAEVHR